MHSRHLHDLNRLADYCKKNESDEKDLRNYIIGIIEKRVKENKLDSLSK